MNLIIDGMKSLQLFLVLLPSYFLENSTQILMMPSWGDGLNRTIVLDPGTKPSSQTPEPNHRPRP